jgi:hypothetical protein
MVFAIIGWGYGQTTEDSIGRRAYGGAILGGRIYLILENPAHLAGSDSFGYAWTYYLEGVLE